MATIHPSRLGLVPQSSRDIAPHKISSSPRRSLPPRHSPSPLRDHDRRELLDGRRQHNDRREDESSRRHSGYNRGRSRSRSRSRERRGYERERQPRRQSPTYGDYKRPSVPPPPLPPPIDAPPAPWHNERNMYPNRGDDVGRHGGDRSYGADNIAGGDYFESRRQQRLNSNLSIWPPSPKEPSRSLSPERSSKRRRKHKRDRSPTPSDTDSEDERRRRRRRKEKERERDRDMEKKKRSKDNDYERERSRKRTRARSLSRPHSEEDQWVEKARATEATPVLAKYEAVAASRARTNSPEESDDEELGPMPAQKANTTTNSRKDERQYGGALLRGEGSAMAAFLQEGGTDARIPRRGEIGLTSDEIAKYESAGYVMSGSRHRVMNAVRMRKENQVISAEEKRGILKLQQEERERREMILREEFQELLQEKLKGAEGPRRV